MVEENDEKKGLAGIWDTVKGFCRRLIYIFGLVFDTRPWILFAMMFIAIANGVLPVVKALVSADILNQLAKAYTDAQSGAQWEMTAILKPIIIQFALMFLTSIITNLDTFVTRVSGELVVNTVKLRLMNKAKTVDIGSFDRPEFYEKLENASGEAGHRPIQIISATFRLVCQAISMISFIVILWGVSHVAPFIVAVLAIPSAIINLIYRKKTFRYVRFRSKDRRQLAYYSSVLTNKDLAKEVKMYGAADFFTDMYNSTFKKYFAGLKKIFVGEGSLNIALAVITTVVNCGLFLYIANGVLTGESNVGDYSLYTGALNSVSSAIYAIVGAASTIYEGTLFIDNLIEFINEPQTVVPSIAEPIKPERHVGHRIEFKDVSFRYPGMKRNTINHFSTVIEPGSTVVLVGLNGAGKTTLIKLLTRLYDPTEGVILLDGRDIREYDTKELYKMFGIIFQDFGKYAVSVSENIAMSDINAPLDEERISNAAKQGSADAFINALPEKYETMLTRNFAENGTDLSVGQWQKLSVARAFYSDSDFLILDEPTASLDAIAEQEIYNQFDTLRKDKTTIFVSHRLSSATTADKILVVENGTLIEEGNHAELMKLGGKYCELFSVQAERYMEHENDVK